MEKTSTVANSGKQIFKGKKLTIGLDLGDRWSFYCVMDEAGQVILEHKLPTTSEAMKQTFGKIPRSLIALETGTHSPWVSRLLSELGHEVIVAHAQKVQLITKSNRKDDRHDARTLARLARFDPALLGPVRHRSVQAQLHLTVIRARAELVSARTALVNAARGLVKSYGQRLPKCGTYQVSRELATVLSAELRDVLERGPLSVCEESGGRLFFGIATWPQELRRERATKGHQQRRGPVSAHDDGAGSALHSGTFWRRQ
jgi:transposase